MSCWETGISGCFIRISPLNSYPHSTSSLLRRPTTYAI